MHNAALNSNRVYTSKKQTPTHDIESNLLINKEIVKGLISDSKYDPKLKKQIEKQNIDNIETIKQIIETNKKLQELQFRGLINAQIIEDFKRKEKEVYTECEEKYNELKDQLIRKEAILQSYEKKNRDAEMLLKKYSKNDNTIKAIIVNAHKEDKEVNISNVLNENEHIKSKIVKLTEEKTQLQASLDALQKENSELQIRYQKVCKMPFQ